MSSVLMHDLQRLVFALRLTIAIASDRSSVRVFVNAKINLQIQFLLLLEPISLDAEGVPA
jgi:hypothetical protein